MADRPQDTTRHAGQVVRRVGKSGSNPRPSQQVLSRQRA